MCPIWIRTGKLANAARGYYGAHLGKLTQLHHGVSGDVYAVDSRTLFLKNFNYDGEGPGNIQYFFMEKSSLNLCIFCRRWSSAIETRYFKNKERLNKIEDGISHTEINKYESVNLVCKFIVCCSTAISNDVNFFFVCEPVHEKCAINLNFGSVTFWLIIFYFNFFFRQFLASWWSLLTLSIPTW